MSNKFETVKTTEVNPMHLEHVIKLASHFQESDMSHFEVEIDGLKVCFKREVQAPVVMSAPPVAQPVITVSQEQTQVNATEATETSVKGEVVKAPLVGTYYESNTPGAKPFVSVGDRVKKGDVIAIIEAMKVMNEIEAPCDGQILEIKVCNESAVGFNEPLMIIG